jgi:hypothetical protein
VGVALGANLAQAGTEMNPLHRPLPGYEWGGVNQGQRQAEPKQMSIITLRPLGGSHEISAGAEYQPTFGQALV